MKNFLLLGGLLLGSTVAFAGPCQPGTLADYINLGATGCDVNDIQFSNFELAPIQNFATEIVPETVLLTPGGGPSTRGFVVTLDRSAAAGELLESFFRFNAAGHLIGATISLGSPVVTGDGAVAGILDVCAGGDFLGIEPIGCTGTAATAAAFAIESDRQLSSSLALPVSSFFDVFADITIDGGLNGSAVLDSAVVTVTTPEPSTLLLMLAALGSLGIVKARRGRRP